MTKNERIARLEKKVAGLIELFNSEATKSNTNYERVETVCGLLAAQTGMQVEKEAYITREFKNMFEGFGEVIKYRVVLKPIAKVEATPVIKKRTKK